ncbi:MAG: lipid A export permease/ATP-binding protein MsbA [Gammaproteobacteria bacterium]|nr:lipid A export permease/ATP-binding protein MsbA [Gammaproteobacteria bacterium]
MASSETASSQGLNTYRRLLSYVAGRWRYFGVSVLGLAVYAATDTAFAALMKPLLDGSFVERDPEVIFWLPLVLMGIFVARGVAGFFATYFMAYVGWHIIKQLRQQMFHKLITLPTAIYDRSSAGEMISKLTFNVERVSSAATNSLTVLIRDSLTIFGLLAWMFYLNAYMTLGFLLVGPFMAWIFGTITRRFRRISHRIQGSMGQVTHVVEEAIEGHRVVKIFGGTEYENERFEKLNEENRAQQMKMIKTRAISVPLVQSLAALALASIIFAATRERMIDEVTVGTFMSFMIAMMMLFAPLKRLTMVNEELQKGIAAGQSIFELLDQESEPDQGQMALQKVTGKVAFREVRFAYQADKGEVLKGISFEMQAGQTVAFVGRSGSGKSTLANLLTRLYEPQAGDILLDDQPITEVSLASLRDQLAYVGQDVTLFNDSIANNIAYGKLAESSLEAIQQAAKAAHADEFIEALPDGYQTQVGENGVLLSGGQRQRLAIARAFLKNAPILILDEATSALDTHSERHVQAGLEALLHNRTTLVIAHRLSTIEHADQIMVMEAGEIVERGSHHDLLAKQGAYAALHQLQFATEKTL